MDKKVFYDTVRPHINLTTQNVQGFEKVLDYLESVQPNVQRAANEIATAFWETAQTMHPVREAYWLSEDWRRRNLRYYPHYGRGLIQVTWLDNYIRLAVLLGLPRDTFVRQPDLLLEWEYALPALHLGMESGLYTGKSLEDYIDDVDESDEEDYREYKNARRIVNGTDRADKLAELSIIFEKGLKASNFGKSEEKTSTQKPVQSISEEKGPIIPETKESRQEPSTAEREPTSKNTDSEVSILTKIIKYLLGIK